MRGAWAASAAATISAIIRPPVGPNGITAERCCQGGGSDATRLLRDAAAPNYFLRLLPKLRGFDMLKVDPAMPDAEVTLEYLCDNIWIVGSPDTVARKLAQLSADVGGFGTLLVIAHEWTPPGAWERSMRRLADDVLPGLRRTGSVRSPAAG